jgi:hypothetical protein
MNYSKQVSNDHYSDLYDDLQRFVSYFYQKEIILKYLKKASGEGDGILEVGKGNGFLFDYLKKRQIKIKTFDISKDLSPDYTGDVTEIGEIVKEKFEMVVCFETLEHIRFEDIPGTLDQIKEIASEYLIISVPQVRLYLSFWVKIPKLKPLSFLLSAPFPMRHKFDGEHYWELGKNNYSVEKFENILIKNFEIKERVTFPLNPYHRIYVLKKNK